MEKTVKRVKAAVVFSAIGFIMCIRAADPVMATLVEEDVLIGGSDDNAGGGESGTSDSIGQGGENSGPSEDITQDGGYNSPSDDQGNGSKNKKASAVSGKDTKASALPEQKNGAEENPDKSSNARIVKQQEFKENRQSVQKGSGAAGFRVPEIKRDEAAEKPDDEKISEPDDTVINDRSDEQDNVSPGYDDESGIDEYGYEGKIGTDISEDQSGGNTPLPMSELKAAGLLLLAGGFYRLIKKALNQAGAVADFNEEQDEFEQEV